MSEYVQVNIQYNHWTKPMIDYVMMFGTVDLIPEKWFYSKHYKSVDDVYSECVKKRITWRELTKWDYDKRKKIVL